MFTAGEEPVAGLMELPASARPVRRPAGWIGYLGVDDVDAIAARIKAAGGASITSPGIPTIGRFAVVADPQTPPSACSVHRG